MSKRVHIDWPRTIAGALAAVAAAVVLSKLGAAGTLTGAAIGSVVLSLVTQVGTHGIQSTADRMLEAQKEAARKVSQAQAEVRRARAVSDVSPESRERLVEVEEALESAKSELAQDVPTSDIPVVPASPDAATEVLPTAVASDDVVAEPSASRALMWRRVLTFALGSFLLAVALITAFELIGGRPLSSYVGGSGSGTTVGNTFGGGGGGSKAPTTPATTPTPSTSPTPTPSPNPTASTSPTPSPSPSASPTPSPSASATPSDTTTPTPSPTASNTP